MYTCVFPAFVCLTQFSDKIASFKLTAPTTTISKMGNDTRHTTNMSYYKHLKQCTVVNI